MFAQTTIDQDDMALLQRFAAQFRSQTPVPSEYRPVFFHLVMDMAWMGVISGTTLAFLGVFATRQGASTFQIGLLSAVPGLVNLIFALPAGSWFSRHSMGKSVFWASVLSRIFYVFLVPLPIILQPAGQVWFIILATFLMTIPGTALVVGFNSFFAEVVPVEWRGYIIGIRNAVLAVVATFFTFLSGQALDILPFPLGYQILFVIGFLGAGMSSLHLFYLSRISQPAPNHSIQHDRRSSARVEATRKLGDEIKKLYRRGIESLRLDVMNGSFARIMGLLFAWHLSQFMTIPIVTPFIVNQLKMSDQLIGIANGLFNLTVFLGSLRLSQAASRFGYKRITGGGIILLSAFPIFTAFGAGYYILANIIGGVGWAMVGGGMYNFLLERIPGEDRPAYMAWYNLIANAAILIGSLGGPAVGGVIGISTALLLFGFCRFLAGVAILRWG